MENFIDVVMYSQHQKSCCHLFKCMWMCPAYSHVLHSVCLLYHHMQFMSVTTALSFAFYGEQGGSKMLTKEQISAIASLKLGGRLIGRLLLWPGWHSIKQCWTKKNREVMKLYHSTRKGLGGHVTALREPMMIFQGQVDKEPWETAKELKRMYPKLF